MELASTATRKGGHSYANLAHVCDMHGSGTGGMARTGSSVKGRLGPLVSADREGNSGGVARHSGSTGFGC